MHKNVLTPANIDAIHQAGKLATQDAWHFRKDYELTGAGCRSAYAAGIDLAISNTTKRCVTQRNGEIARRATLAP